MSSYMKGGEIIEYIVRGDIPDLDEVRKECLRRAAGRQTAVQQTAVQPDKRHVCRRPLIACLVIVFCLSFAAPAFAVNIPATYELLYSVSPAAAQFFKPVQKSCEYNGIRMEVIATHIYDNTAELYVSLRDLTGNRVDETTDLFDSCSINRPFDCSATCQLVSFDEETNTALFFFSMTEWGNQKISGKKITFTLKRFLSGKQFYDGVPVSVDMTDIPVNPGTMPAPIEEYGGGFSGDYAMDEGIPDVLVPSSEIYFGVDGVVITGMGYIDDMLHIQTCPGTVWKHDNHGYIYFKDKSGNIVMSFASIVFYDYQNREKVRFEEFVYNIPQSQLDEYEVFGYFVTGAVLTEGYWQVTFPLQ